MSSRRRPNEDDVGKLIVIEMDPGETYIGELKTSQEIQFKVEWKGNWTPKEQAILRSSNKRFHILPTGTTLKDRTESASYFMGNGLGQFPEYQQLSTYFNIPLTPTMRSRSQDRSSSRRTRMRVHSDPIEDDHGGPMEDNDHGSPPGGLMEDDDHGSLPGGPPGGPPTGPPGGPPAGPSNRFDNIIALINNPNLLIYLADLKIEITHLSRDLQKFINKYSIGPEQKILLPYFELFLIKWSIENELQNRTITDIKLKNLYIQFNRYFNYIYRKPTAKKNIYDSNVIPLIPLISTINPSYNKNSNTDINRGPLNMNDKNNDLSYSDLFKFFDIRSTITPNIFCRIYGKYYEYIQQKQNWRYVYNNANLNTNNCPETLNIDNPFIHEIDGNSKVIYKETTETQEILDDFKDEHKPFYKWFF